MTLPGDPIYEPEKPKRLTSYRDRKMARCQRDQQWAFMERVAALGMLWVCWWNKDRHHQPSPSAQYADGSGYRDDLLVCGLIDGCELSEWLNSHKDWWIIGEWSDERYAAPVQLTDAGRSVLENRAQYDMERVTGGLIEPGWECTPLPPKKGK